MTIWLSGWALDEARWLWLALAALPCGLIALRWFGGMSPARRWTAVIARAGLLFLLAAMLAGLASVRRTDRVAVVGVIDLSGSVRRFGNLGAGPDGRPLPPEEAARAFLAASERDRGVDDLLGLVVFDGRAAAVATPARAGVLDRSMAPTGTEGTDLGGALRLAAGLVPPDAAARLVLFSDGNQTTGDALGAAGALAGGGDRPSVTIDVVPVPYRVGTEVLVESVDVPARASAESTMTVRIAIRSTGPARGLLRLSREGVAVDANSAQPGTALAVQLAPGRTVVPVEVPLPPGRVHRFEAVFEPELDAAGVPEADITLENNRGSAFTITPGRGSVLLVDGVSDGAQGGAGSTLAGVLGDDGLDVEVVSPAGMPTDLLALQAYDLVILENVAADEVTASAQSALSDCVRDLGVGLVMVGGPDSFGAGGWRGSPIEPILPVALDLPDKLVMPEAAVVFVLDSSGSMGHPVLGSAQSQQAIANESAALAIGVLDERDLVGVIAFNNQARVIVPLGPNDRPERSQSAVRSIGAGGGTNLPPGLRLAQRELAGVEAKLKHVIVLSDGQSQNTGQLPAIAAEMKAQGIRVSTIAVGDDADLSALETLASEGGGAFYRVSNANVLPRVFLKAVRIVRSPLIREVPFEPVVLPTGSPIVEGIGRLPELGGLVLTRGRQEPTITNALASPEGEPVLAHWPVGLGQVAAFTSDAHAWAGAWIESDAYRRIWTRIARQFSRVPTSAGPELRAVFEGGVLRLRLEAFEEGGAPIDALAAPATVYGPAGSTQQVRLRQTGPGIYEGQAQVSATGSYVVLVTPRRAGVRMGPVLGGASVGAGAEYARLEPDTGLLASIARATGGRVLSLDGASTAALFDRAGVEPRRALTPLLPALLWWSLLVFLLDVGTRRVAWDRLVSKRFGADWRTAAAEAVRDRTGQAAASVGGLRSGRERRAQQGPIVAARPLGEEDAVGEARRQRAARLEAERQRLRDIRAQMNDAAPTRPPGPAPAPPGPPTPPPDSGEGLLAAQRRARERYASGEQE